MIRRGLAAGAAVTLLVFLAALPASAADPVTVSSSLDRELVAVGDRMTLTLEVTRAPGVLIQLPAFVDRGPDVEVISSEPPRHETLPDGSVHSTFRYQIAAFRVGDLVLSPLAVRYTGTDGSEQVALTEPIPFRIRSVIPPSENPSDIRDLKAQLTLPGAPPAGLYRPVFGAVLLLDLALLALALRRRLRGRRRPIVPAVPAPQPSGSYIAELDGLAHQELNSANDYRDFYRRLARTVRAFLADRYNLPARSLTRGELEQRMAGAGLDQWQTRLVSGLLQEADRVVYAEYLPARERATGALGLAYQILELGTPQSEPEPALVGA